MKHSEKISELLEARGWSMLELARRANVGREQARRLAIRIPPTVLAANRIAKALGVSAEWLFDDGQEWAEMPSPGSGEATSASDPDLVNLKVLRHELRKLLDLPQYGGHPEIPGLPRPRDPRRDT